MPTLLTTPPVAPQTLAALQALGIRSVEELRDTGSVQAFLLLKAAGLTVTRSTLWQLEALLLGIKPQELPQTQKKRFGTSRQKPSARCRFPHVV